jgi:hypothetical protein
MVLLAPDVVVQHRALPLCSADPTVGLIENLLVRFFLDLLVVVAAAG